MTYKNIKSQNVKDKVVLVRVDYNVPMQDGKITDDLRIRASLPTLEYLREAGAKKIILISHLGRPVGEDEKFSLKPVAKQLEKLLNKDAATSQEKTENSDKIKVAFVPAVTGEQVEKAVAELGEGGILLLENLRFYPGEKGDDPEFIKSIIDATGAEIYVQDGFAVVHRAHASTDAVAQFLPVYMGLLLEKEVDNLTKVTENPEKPVLMIIGGAKVEDKKPLIEKFVKDANQIVVGGKIAADGYPSGPNIYVAEDFDEDASGAKLDVGPLSMGKIAGYITDAKTIIWNGLMGKAEDPAYSTASTITAEMIGERSDATTVICGGDTTGFVEHLMKDHPNLHYSLVSTGGGAALEFLLGKELPGLKVIQKD